MISAIILAGGQSYRMKSPKALLPINDQNFVQSILQKLEPLFDPCVVVAGADYPKIKKWLSENSRAQIVHNRNWKAGQFSSLQEGVRHVFSLLCEAVLVWPVDLPLVQAETLQALVEEYGRTKRAVTIPVRQSKRGHPVIYDRRAMDDILKMDARTQTGKELRDHFASDVAYVDVDDDGVLVDIDTPEEYERYIKRLLR